MTVVAGIDVGNSTTEVVLGALGPGHVEVLATGRAPTRGPKGSPASLDNAAALVRRLERRHDLRVASAQVAPLRPVETTTASLPEQHADTGRLWVVARGAGTAGGHGVGIGRPVRLGASLPGDDPLVVVVPRGTGFRDAAGQLTAVAATGRLAAAVLEDDEAVLVANRLAAPVPVVDEVDADAVLGADLVAVEVGSDGRPLRTMTDPLRLASGLQLAPDELAHAAALAATLHDATNAVVAVGGAPASVSQDGGWMDLHGIGRLPFLEGHGQVRSGRVGLARAYALPAADACVVDDLWTVDLAAVATAVRARRAGTMSRPVSLAALHADRSYADPSEALGDRLDVPVGVARSEAEAARAGGLSTPGAVPDAVVIDLGGGTIDAVSPRSAVIAAGGGELMTVSVASFTGVTAAAAEWVKRGPAHRVEAPQVLTAEDGTRSFLDRPAPPETVGWLVVPGPAGPLPFHRTLAPGEWRALRLELKVELVGGNVARALGTLDERPRNVVVVGGPAGDDEVLAALGGALPAGTAIGRGRVAGALGHRFAVAYGLLSLLAATT